MAHHHAHAHLVERQRQQNDVEIEVVTLVQFVSAENTYTGDVVWITPTRPAAKTLVPPAVRTRASSTEEDEPKPTTKPAVKPSSTILRTPSSRTSADTERETAKTETAKTETAKTETVKMESKKVESTLVMTTKSPTIHPASSIVGLVSATATATISATPVAEASSGGMSTGAKAGLALGILLGLAAILLGILFLCRRKKNRMAETKDNEKTGMHDSSTSPPQHGAGADDSNQRNLAAAPQLSLRPVTQLSTNWNENRKSGGNLLTIATTAAPEPERRISAWERPGATNASATATNAVVPPVNPFNDAESQPSTPLHNPFANSAAVDTAQASVPDSPPSTSPLNSTTLNAGSANVTPAIAVAAATKVTAPTATTTVSLPTEKFPAPPSVRAIADATPPNLTWTEDVPASPTTATSATPPVVVAAVGGRPNGPSPGPNNVHRVQLDFNPSMADELELRSGALVRMLHEYDDGWALCISMDRSQQGVVPRTCLSKHPVKPRTGPPPRQGPPQPRGPGMRPAMGPGGVPQPRPHSPANGRMSPGPNQMSPRSMQGSPRARSNSNAPFNGPPRSMSPGPRQMAPRAQESPRNRSNSNAPYAAPPRSMSPGPYGGGPQMAPPPQMGRPRANSASQVHGRRGPAPGPSPMNPNAAGGAASRTAIPGLAM